MARTEHRPHVVIVGSGFGGLFAAQRLRRADVDITLIARTTHHLFQPLLYQVATGILSEGEIAPATREVLRRQKNARVLLGEVTDIDLATRTVTSANALGGFATTYDHLIVAAGAGQSYFGNDDFAVHAPGLKSVDDALELRGRIFGCFELAETATQPEQVDRLLTFVVVGAGPTGVEMAGQIAELARRALPGDFRSFDPRTARVILLDAVDSVLGTFGDRLSGLALRRLREIGVDVQLGAKVVGVDQRGLEVEDVHTGKRRRIEAVCKVWAAGVQASPLGASLGAQSGAAVDRAGRVTVQEDLTLPGHPEVFVVGDMAGTGLPGVAQVAIQGGRYAADRIRGRGGRAPFSYHDKGSMATISRFSAVAAIGDKIRIGGFLAWLMWLAVHLAYIVGFKNRFATLFHWTVSFFGRDRAQRTATTQQVVARQALHELGLSGPLGPDRLIWAQRARDSA
jgi:NADH dehydrogenase